MQPSSKGKTGYPFLQGGGEMGELTRNHDWSGTSLGAPEQWPQSLRTTVGNLLRSKFPMFLWWGDDLIQFYNDAYRPYFGFEGRHPKALGQKGEECWPESWYRIGPLIERVRSGGDATWSEDQLVSMSRDGRTEEMYFTYSYSLVLDDEDRPAGVLVTCVETTASIVALKKIAESEDKFRSLIEQAPIATCFFVGPEFRIEVANSLMIRYWRKDASVIGRKLAEAVPELRGQPFIAILEKIFSTGETYVARGERAELQTDGVPQTYYFDYTYKPVRNALGEVYGIMDMAIDVTEQVMAQQRIREAGAALEGAVELAELATWSLHIKEGKFYYSPRFMDWLGFSEDTKEVDAAYNRLPDEDRQQVADAVEAAVRPGASGIYENEHPIINRLTGQRRIILAQARVSHDASGLPATLSGTARDVTKERELQQALEFQVQQRTDELSLANRELESVNKALQQNNRELEQFAYIASHDLQEPLRKVSTFIEMLRLSLGTVDDRSFTYLNKIADSSARMLQLIRDVLNFSQLSTELGFEPVDLNGILGGLVSDFELMIEQKRAQLYYQNLPVLEANSLQMQQLFGNLLSNALKFTREGVPPVISISAQRLEAGEKRDHANLLPEADYFLITVSDNGIGFSQENADKIFGIFQRLHGKAEFAGTGIGLALCKKIVQNHDGEIWASSEKGKGSMFRILLPEARMGKDRGG